MISWACVSECFHNEKVAFCGPHFDINMGPTNSNVFQVPVGSGVPDMLMFSGTLALQGEVKAILWAWNAMNPCLLETDWLREPCAYCGYALPLVYGGVSNSHKILGCKNYHAFNISWSVSNVIVIDFACGIMAARARSLRGFTQESWCRFHWNIFQNLFVSTLVIVGYCQKDKSPVVIPIIVLTVQQIHGG